MLTAVSVDMFNKILRANNETEVKEVLHEMEELKRYFNDTLVRIFKRFDSKAPKALNDDWVYTNIVNGT